MSIINEALKKTEDHLQKNKPSVKTPTLKPHNSKPLLISILILLLAIKLALELTSHKTKQPPKQVSLTAISTIQTKNLPNPTKEIIPASNPAQNTIKPEEANFTLNGIFYSSDQSYALINNQIVKENDYVDGAKVNLISAHNVELDKNGEKFSLSSGQRQKTL